MWPELVLQDEAPSAAVVKLKLAAGTFLVGRSSKCEFVIDHISVSRRHAEISLRDGVIAVVDLNSRNGTFVDEQRVESANVVCGQRLRFGQVSFVVQDEEADNDSDLNTAWSDGGSLGRPEEDKLSPAQQRVLRLVLQGHSEKETARRLHLSPHTVHNHLQTIYGVLGVHSRAELLALLLSGPKKPGGRITFPTGT